MALIRSWLFRRLAAQGTFLLGLGLLTSPAPAATLLEDSFATFDLGTRWQEHGMGVPNIALQIGFSGDSEVLEMRSNGGEGEFYGIETIAPLSLTGVTSLVVDARVRPINAGVEGTRAAAEVALIGSTGEIARAFTSNNAGPDPESTSDWANHYEDSLDHFADSPAWPHCDVACDAMRNLVLTITATGTTIQAFDDADDPQVPTWEASIEGFTLASLGTSFKLALRQQTVDGGDDAIGFFDHILVTSTEAALTGDFSGNGVLDLADIDLLTGASASGANESRFELTGDNRVNSNDVTFWVKDLRKSWIGDANLNGEFNSGDFVDVFQKGKYELAGANAVWSEGDWDGDGRFTSSDFVAAFQDGGYEQGPRAAVAAVPEPAAISLFLLGLLSVIKRRRTA